MTRLGLGFARAARRSLRISAGTPSAPFTVLAADGWQATVASPSDLSMAPATVSRQGFDNTGSATTLSEVLYLTKRVRQAYPSQASFTADQVALSDYVYSTDTISGVTNNSAQTSPKPVAHWGMVDRRVVGNSLSLEIVAFHRNPRGQKAVACVVFRATDGSTTVTSTVTAPAVSSTTGDKHAVIAYAATLDITSLSAGQITVNAKVYPWYGGSGSVLDSADQSNEWEFSPRAFSKNTSLAASPNMVYVASGGNDSTGYVGTNDSSAAASPCLTVNGAINRARTVLGTGTGALDGLRVRLTAGTWSISTSATANTTNAEIVIEPATGQTKSTVTFNFGAANANANATYCRFRDLTLTRNGANALYNKSGGAAFVDDCAVDLVTNTQTLIGTAGGCGLSFTNSTIANVSGSAMNAGTNQQIRLVRGCSITPASGVLNASLEERCVIGNTIKGMIQNNTAARSLSGVVVAFNHFIGGASGTGMVHLGSPDPIVGAAVVQNVFEFISTTSAIAVGLSNDGEPADFTHLIFWHNTIAGFDQYGRSNILYDETTADLRSHKLQSLIGNIHCQINTKSDIFLTDGTRLGNFAYVHGVGCRGEFSRYRDANSGAGAFKQSYGGIGSSVGTSNTSPGNDPKFTTPAHTTTGPVAGAGGGTYTLQAGSPCLAMVAVPVLAYDFAGTARPSTNDAAGAFTG